MCILNRKEILQKVSLDSGRIEEQQSRSLQQDNAKNQTVGLTTCMTFADLTKAFDGHWKIMSKFWLSTKVHIAMVRKLHDGILAGVQVVESSFSEPFPVTNGAK